MLAVVGDVLRVGSRQAVFDNLVDNIFSKLLFLKEILQSAQ